MNATSRDIFAFTILISVSLVRVYDCFVVSG